MSQSVFSIPPGGKPNYSESPLNGPRSRGDFHGQKGDTCDFYARQIVLNEGKRGSHPDVADTQRRACELLFSAHRKEVTRITTKNQTDMGVVEDLSAHFPKFQFTRNLVKVCAERLLSKLQQEFQENARACFTNFCTQEECDNLADFVKMQRENGLYQAHLDLLVNYFKMSSNNSDDQIKEAVERPFREMSCSSKIMELEKRIFTVQEKLYRLKRSTWHPTQSIEDLMNEIQLHGPHYMKGYIGQVYYKTDPLEAEEKIEGRPVFYWPSDAERVEKTNFHAFVVVGAEKINDEENVYIVDPIDGSTPDPATQKLYRFPFSLFRFYISTLESQRLLAKDTGEPRYFSALPDGRGRYAYYYE